MSWLDDMMEMHRHQQCGQAYIVDPEVAWRIQQAEIHGKAETRGAFRALAEIGLVVAWGETMLRVADLRWVYEGEGSSTAAREVDGFLAEMGVSAAPGIRP